MTEYPSAANYWLLPASMIARNQRIIALLIAARVMLRRGGK